MHVAKKKKEKKKKNKVAKSFHSKINLTKLRSAVKIFKHIINKVPLIKSDEIFCFSDENYH